MEIWIFGNPDLAEDNLPIRILPQLQATFPHIRFSVKDPLDEWEPPKKLWIVDTVRGIDAVTMFSSLDQFQTGPRVSLHDFDLYSQLRLLQKIGKLPELVIYGVPPHLDANEAVNQLTRLIRQCGS